MDLAQLAIIIAVATVNLGLAGAVYLRNKRSTSNRAFAASVVTIVCWLGFAYLSDQVLFSGYALLLNRLTIGSAMLMGGFLLRFALLFPAREAKLRPRWRAYMGVGALLAVATVATPLVVADVHFRAGGTDILPGKAFALLIGWTCVGVLGSVVALVQKYRDARGRQREQLRFMLLGVAVFAVSSVVLGLILPAVTGSYYVARLNNLSPLLLVSLISYAIIKHRLMDIRLLVVRGVAYTFLTLFAGVGMVWLALLAGNSLSGTLHVRGEVFYLLGSLAAVYAYQPVRRGIDNLTDRVFYRGAYSPDALLSKLGSSMTSTLDQHGLAEMLASELATGMRLTFAAVAFSCGGVPEVISSVPGLTSADARVLLDLSEGLGIIVTDEAEPDSGGYPALEKRDVRVLAPLRAADVPLGTIILGPKQSGTSYSTQDVKFLEVVVAEAAITMRNAFLFDEKNQRVRELTALNSLAFALGQSIELDAVLDGALEQLVAVTGADSGSIMLLNDEAEHLTIAASRGIAPDIAASTRIPVGESIAGWVAQCNHPLTLPVAADSHLSPELFRDDVASAICAPVMSKDSVIGVLSVNREHPGEPFTAENLHVVTSIAGQLGMAIENARLYGDLEKTFLGTISALAAAVDAKDPYTAGHSNEVTTLAVTLAEALRLDASEIQTIRIAATLHDIGKIGIDGDILLKPGRLTDAEREHINRHPTIGADILAPLDFLRDTVPLVLFHHERFGGGGYPSGISGEAIPLGARIIAVADAFNAMVSDRPYRDGLSLDAAIHEVRTNSGTQFDPVVAATFLTLIENGSVSRSPEPSTALQAVAWRTEKQLFS